MAEAGGLMLPPKNEKLKKQEEKALHGANLTVHLRLPSGEVEVLLVKNSTEVGHVKILLHHKCGIAANDIVLKLNGEPMLNPLSLCDHSGVEGLSEVYVDVEYE